MALRFDEEQAARYEQMHDGEKLVAWLHEAADELTGAHAYLDFRSVPRFNEGRGVTLAWRIDKYAEMLAGPEPREPATFSSVEGEG